jgi:hypothetical protein
LELKAKLVAQIEYKLTIHANILQRRPKKARALEHFRKMEIRRRQPNSVLSGILVAFLLRMNGGKDMVMPIISREPYKAAKPDTHACKLTFIQACESS